jgi:Flp pilus assembly protein TadD
MMREGNFEGALKIWKKQTVEDSENADNWHGLATVLDAMGEGDKANTVRMHIQRLQAQAVSEATGRNMEDIMADLLDDGVLNFSSGTDAKTQDD